MVGVFGETTGYYALQYMLNQMQEDPVGRQILKYFCAHAMHTFLMHNDY